MCQALHAFACVGRQSLAVNCHGPRHGRSSPTGQMGPAGMSGLDKTKGEDQAVMPLRNLLLLAQRTVLE